MEQLKIEPNRPPKVQGYAPYALGFRPFFVLAGVSAALLLLLWLAAWRGRFPVGDYYGLVGWHSHEMLFGYAGAVIAGFLLTAVRNWSGIDTLSGGPLAALAGLWLMGRLLALLPGPFPPLAIALVDLAFLPLLAVALSGPLWKGKQKINRMFLPLLGAMTLANILVHLEALGMAQTAARGTGLMLNLIVLLVVIVGGRVIPFFIEMAVSGAKPKSSPRIEQFSFGALLLLILLELLYPENRLLAPLALAVALTQALRLRQWHARGIWSIPILWVLFTGYAWLVLGFVLKGLAAVGFFAPNQVVHALTVGGIGVLTLGMMARVSLGHTGRPMRSSRFINLAFVLLNLAALSRVFGPLVLPSRYGLWIDLSGGLWILSFVIFAFVYIPILIRARADGRPG
jgi:uncharacterized protein involved in response to NO